MGAPDTKVAELTVPLIEIGDDAGLAVLVPFGSSMLSSAGVEMSMTITGTRLHLVTTGPVAREYTVDILGVADAALRAIDAQLRAEAAEQTGVA